MKGADSEEMLAIIEKQKDKIKKTALLGIQGMKKVLLQAYIKFSNNKDT